MRYSDDPYTDTYIKVHNMQALENLRALRAKAGEGDPGAQKELVEYEKQKAEIEECKKRKLAKKAAKQKAEINK